MGVKCWPADLPALGSISIGDGNLFNHKRISVGFNIFIQYKNTRKVKYNMVNETLILKSSPETLAL